MQVGHRTPSCDCWCVGAPSQKVPHRGGVVLQRVLCCRRNLDKAELPIEVQGIDTHPLQTRRMPSMALTLETLWHCAALASSSCPPAKSQGVGWRHCSCMAHEWPPTCPAQPNATLAHACMHTRWHTTTQRSQQGASPNETLRNAGTRNRRRCRRKLPWPWR
jgi:hypothetical protein